MSAVGEVCIDASLAVKVVVSEPDSHFQHEFVKTRRWLYHALVWHHE